MASTFDRVLFRILVLGNIIGVLFGFTYWYGAQLLESPLKYWIFIPASPLFALLFATSALMIYFKKKNSVLFYLTAVGLIKYGIWTVVFWWDNFSTSGLPLWMMYWLIGSHAIMALEAFILFSRIEFRKWHVLLAWIVFGLYDYMHYFGGLVTNKVAVVKTDMYTAIALTIFVPLVVYWLVKFFRYRNWKILV